MSIIIRRNTGWNGVASKMQIKLNGKIVGSIMEKEQIELEIPEGKTNLQVTRFANKSNKLVVEDGDIIEITPTDFYRKSVSLSLPMGIITGIILIVLIPKLVYRLIIVAVFSVIIVVAEQVFKLFKIKIVSEKQVETYED